MPQAYESALVEMVRRRQFRTILDSDVAKLRSWIKEEQEKRQEFSKNVHTYLPSQFCPSLRDNAPELSLDGPASEYSFADVKDAVTHFEPIKSAFESDSNGEYGQNPQSARPSNHENEFNVGFSKDESEMAKKIKELTTEMQLRKGEYTSNLKEKEEMVQKCQITVHVKED